MASKKKTATTTEPAQAGAAFVSPLAAQAVQDEATDAAFAAHSANDEFAQIHATLSACAERLETKFAGRNTPHEAEEYAYNRDLLNVIGALAGKVRAHNIKIGK